MRKKCISVLLAVVMCLAFAPPAAMAAQASPDSAGLTASGGDSGLDETEILIEGSGGLSVLLGGVWTALDDVDLMLLPAEEPLRFRASSESAELVSVTLDGNSLPFEAAADASGAAAAWEFTAALHEAGCVLIVRFSDAQTPEEGVIISVIGPGRLEMQSDGGWLPVGTTADVEIPRGQEVQFRASSVVSSLESVTLDGEAVPFEAVTLEADDTDRVTGWRFAVTFHEEGRCELTVTFAAGTVDDADLTIEIQGTGTLEMQTDTVWVPITEDAEVGIPVGEEVTFRAASDAAELASVTLDGAAVPFSPIMQEGADGAGIIIGWQFAATFRDGGCTLVVTFSDADAERHRDVVVTVEGTGSLFVLAENSWIPVDAEAVLNVPVGREVSFRAVSSETELISVMLDGAEVPFYGVVPAADLPAPTEWTFGATFTGESQELVVAFSDAVSPRTAYTAVTVQGVGTVELRTENGWTLVGSGDGLDSLIGDSLTFRAASPGTLDAVEINGEDVPFYEDGEGEDAAFWTFTIAPYERDNELIVKFSEGGQSDLIISDSAPEEIVFLETEDGLYLTGLEARAAGAAVTVDTVLGWLEAPGGGTITICTAGSEAPAEAAAPAATGMAVVLSDGDAELLRAEICVTGDVLGTGLLSVAQVVRMATALRGTAPLNGVYLLAGDLNETGAVDISDLVAEAALLVAGDAGRVQI